MPPTDNLYKFIAISGIIIYLFAFSFAVKLFRESRDLEYKYTQESIQTKNLISKDSARIEILNLFFKQETRVPLKSLSISSLDTIELKGEQQKIFREFFELVANEKSNKSLLENIGKRIPEPVLYEAIGRIVFAILFVIGAGMIPFGLYQWYVKIHIPNMILVDHEVKLVQKDKYEAKHFFIKRRQFEFLCWFLLLILLVFPFVIDGWALAEIS